AFGCTKQRTEENDGSFVTITHNGEVRACDVTHTNPSPHQHAGKTCDPVGLTKMGCPCAHASAHASHLCPVCQPVNVLRTAWEQASTKNPIVLLYLRWFIQMP